MSYLLVFLISAMAAGLQASLGFGYGIVGMALFPFVLPYVTSLILCTVSGTLSNAIVAIRYRKYIQWDKLWLPLILSLVASTVMSRLVADQAEGTLKQILGIFLVVLSLYFLLFKERIKIKGSPLSGGICGLISGLCGGFFGVNGPPAVIYFMAAAEGDNKRYLATAQAYFLILNIHITLMRFLNGAAITKVFYATVAGIAGVGAGTLIGLKIFKKMDLTALYRFVYLFMAVMGVFIFLTA